MEGRGWCLGPQSHENRSDEGVASCLQAFWEHLNSKFHSEDSHPASPHCSSHFSRPFVALTQAAKIAEESCNSHCTCMGPPQAMFMGLVYCYPPRLCVSASLRDTVFSLSSACCTDSSCQDHQGEPLFISIAFGSFPSSCCSLRPLRLCEMQSFLLPVRCTDSSCQDRRGNHRNLSVESPRLPVPVRQTGPLRTRRTP